MVRCGGGSGGCDDIGGGDDKYGGADSNAGGDGDVVVAMSMVMVMWW